jgi:hypothetical protein
MYFYSEIEDAADFKTLELCKKEWLAEFLDGEPYRRSQWNRHFSCDEISKTIQKRLDPTLQTFEIGSGRGYMAYFHNSKERLPRISCIDPRPTEYCDGPVFQVPICATVGQLLKIRTDIKTAPTQLVFIWPPDEDSGLTFAEQALELFENIRCVVVVCTACGLSGTIAFKKKLDLDFQVVEKRIVRFNETDFLLQVFSRIENV